MSQTTTTSSASPSPQPSEKKKRRTWKQRLKIAAIVVVVAALLIRVGLNLLLPTVVRKVANAYDLDCTYERMSLGLLSGNAHIWNLELRPSSGGDSIIRADYIQGSISTPNLFRGRLVVYRAEVDGVDIIVDREPDGSVPLLQRLLSSPEDAPISVEPEPETESGELQPLNLQPPLRIDAVRLSHVTATFRDRSVTPTFETTVRTSLRVSDVGSTGSPARFEMEVTADPVLDALIINGVMHSTPTSMDADLDVRVRGLHPQPVTQYLLPLGIRPIAEDITLQAQAKLTAEAIPDSTDLTAKLTVSGISAEVDHATWASLESITLNARRINPTEIELGQLRIETGRASAQRSPEGYLQIAGFELVPTASAQTATPTPATTPPIEVSSGAHSDASTPFRLSLDELRIVDMQAVFHDQAVQPASELIAQLNHFTVKDVVYDTQNRNNAITVEGSATVSGVIQAVTWNGTLTPFADEQRAEIHIRADGIRPDALRPYLQAIGLESNLNSGTFTADVVASHVVGDDASQINAQLTNMRLIDGESVWMDLSSATVNGLSISPTDGAIHIQEIEVTGPTVNIRRNEEGGLVAFGVKTLTEIALSSSPSPVKQAPRMPAPQSHEPPQGKEATAVLTLPRVQIDRYTWKNIHLNFKDYYDVETPVVLVGQAGMEATDLVFDPHATQSNSKPGQFKAWMELPGVIERLAINGAITATGQGAEITSDFQGEAITGAAIAPYLQPLGIEVLLTDGHFHGKAAAKIATVDHAVHVDVHASDIVYADGDDELAGVNGVRVARLALKPGRIEMDLVQIDHPRGQVKRNADGSVETAGIRIITNPPATQPAVPQVVTAGPPEPLVLPAAPIDIVLKQFRLNEATMEIADLAVDPPLETQLRGNVILDNVSLDANQSARLTITGGIDGIIDEASIDGTLVLAPDAPSITLDITAQNIRGDRLAGYLPSGMSSTLRDGYFSMILDAALANHAKGGVKGHLVIHDLRLQEQADQTDLAHVGALILRAERLDPVGGILRIEEVSSEGVELEVVKSPDGVVDLLGLRVGQAPKSEVVPAVIEADQPDVQPTTTAAATTQPSTDVAGIIADARRALPLLTVGTLDLKLNRLRMRGFASPDGAPIDLSGVRLYNAGPIELGGEAPDQRPPLKLQIDGAINPVVARFGVVIEAIPFEVEPELTIEVNASGINGKGLTDIAPELDNLIDGESLTEGTFSTRLTASLNYGRRGPRDWDLSRGFTAEVSVKPVEFRGQPDGPVLAGLEEIRGEGIQVQPRSGNVTIRSIEILRPIGRFVRDEQGLHVLGLVIPLKEREAPTAEPDEVVEAKPVPPEVPPAPSSPRERPQNEIRLDRFAISGIDVVFEDRTTQPSTLVPLKTLDVEVRDISNQMLWTGKPMRFDMLCTSDQVPLPPRKGRIAQGDISDDGLEMRELFSQITARGHIGLKQTQEGDVILTGWAKTSVSGFELLGIRGLAEAQEIIIGGGILDDTNDIRFRDDGLIETRNRVVLTNLSLSEPPNGLIQRTLQLPAPIDVAIGAITDPDGSITLNLPVTIESGEVDAGKLLGSALGAVTEVLVTAIASAPVKAVGGVGDLLGLGDKGEQAPEPPVELAFLPGVATLEPAEARKLAVLAERMRRDRTLELQLRHEMSANDVAHAAVRANPPIEDVRVMIDRMRRSKSQLLAERSLLAAQARAQFASHADAVDDSIAMLRAVDRRLAQIDSSLEQLGELLRPGAAAQADRRTRAASLEVAQERFAVIQAALVDAGVPNAEERIRLTNPQFDPSDALPRGRVIITVVARKR